MSLWADYHKERLGWETIELEGGFIAYSIALPFCCINEIYVKPDLRNKDIASRLGDQVVLKAKEAGCTHLWSQVSVLANGSTDALKATLAYGFKVSKAQEDRVILVKEI